MMTSADKEKKEEKKEKKWTFINHLQSKMTENDKKNDRQFQAKANEMGFLL